jgi:NAD(P)-dependent dehydrogenase (short-subunit alcohol dehydrogenase family)
MLQGRVAVITGGSRGIGLALARELIGHGAAVALGARDAERLQQAANELSAQSPDVLAHPLDVTDESSVRDFFAAVTARFGRLDILVNNAGAFDGGPFADLSLETWNKVIDTCLTGTFLCSRAAFQVMQLRRSGRILNIGSISAQRPRPDAAPYAAAKFGVWGLTQALAIDGRPYGIVCSCLHPGNVLVERRQSSGLSTDDEPMMTAETIARAAMAMLLLPDDVNFLEAIVLPRDQAYLARG